jgi:hypothetical protein
MSNHVKIKTIVIAAITVASISGSALAQAPAVDHGALPAGRYGTNVEPPDPFAPRPASWRLAEVHLDATDCLVVLAFFCLFYVALRAMKQESHLDVEAMYARLAEEDAEDRRRWASK